METSEVFIIVQFPTRWLHLRSTPITRSRVKHIKDDGQAFLNCLPMRFDELFLAKIESFGYGQIAGVIRAAQVGEQPAAQANHLEQPAARTLIVPVGTQMIGQHGDPFGENCDLDIR